jgi:hypothetical protein
MVTFHDVVAQADDKLRLAKRAARFAREDSRANPQSRALKIALDDAEHAAVEAGRELALWRFEAEIERWNTRILEGDVIVDPLLRDLAPQFRGEPDWLWVAAAHVKRAGWPVPKGWRSEVTGESLDQHNQSEPGSIAGSAA